jgi:hypothetical protein
MTSTTTGDDRAEIELALELARSLELTGGVALATASDEVRTLARVALFLKAKLDAMERPADDDDEDPALRAEALRRTPSNARLMAGIARRLAGQGPQIEGDFGPGEIMAATAKPQTRSESTEDSDMPAEHPVTNGAPRPFTPPRSTDERGRLLPMTDEQRRATVEEGNRMLDELAEMTDETDTPELWDEVLRNLGVDPATGRGLPK